MARKTVSKFAVRSARAKTAKKRRAALGKQGNLKNLMDAMTPRK